MELVLSPSLIALARLENACGVAAATGAAAPRCPATVAGTLARSPPAALSRRPRPAAATIGGRVDCTGPDSITEVDRQRRAGRGSFSPPSPAPLNRRRPRPDRIFRRGEGAPENGSSAREYRYDNVTENAASDRDHITGRHLQCTARRRRLLLLPGYPFQLLLIPAN